MSTRINTNTTAYEAALNLSKNSDKLSQNIHRLSSGLRINTAADDASGYVISSSLSAQSAGLTQATNNTNDAINVVKTAEGALNEVQSLLVNIRQTIVQAANTGSNNTTALQADADSVAAAVASINRIAGTTQFNGKNLLDGSANSAGAAVTAGVGTASSTGSTSLALVSQATSYGTTAIASGHAGYTQAVANVEKAVFTGGLASDTFGGSFSIEGKTVVLNGTSNTNSQIATAIQQQTGLNYAISGSALAATGLTFTNQATGAPAGSTDFTNLTSTTGTATTTSNPTVGANAFVTVNSLNSDKVSADGKTFSFTTGALKGLSLSTNATTTNADIGEFSATADTSKAGNNLQFQIGANAGQTISVSIASTKANNIGSAGGFNLSDLLAGGALSLTDATGANQQKALAVVDQAIQDISTAAEKLGSTQTNALQSNLNSLGVAQSNTDASNSTIRDTNLSSEIVDYTKNQILV
ncbi:MAG: hypothetical protein M3Y13_11735, partial [Armatimonadota bacterium]|nr:hypothetical protein [Armatimonadota bacterium]